MGKGVVIGVLSIVVVGGLLGCSGGASSPIGSGEQDVKAADHKETAANDLGSNDPIVGVWVLPSPGGGAYSFTLHANGDMARGLPDGGGKIVSPCAEEDRPAAVRGVPDDGKPTKCGAWHRDGDAVVIRWAGLPKAPYRCFVSKDSLRCDDDDYRRGKSAEGITLTGTFELDWSGPGGYSPPGETTTANLSRQITFRGDVLEATKWTGLTTTYDPTLTNRQGSQGVGQDGLVRASYRFKSFTIEVTLEDGTTDQGRAYVVYDKGEVAMLYVQGYGHMLPAR